MTFPLSRLAGDGRGEASWFALPERNWKGSLRLPSPCPLPQAREGKARLYKSQRSTRRIFHSGPLFRRIPRRYDRPSDRGLIMRKGLLGIVVGLTFAGAASADEWVVEAHFTDQAALQRAARLFDHVIVGRKHNTLRVETNDKGIAAL